MPTTSRTTQLIRRPLLPVVTFFLRARAGFHFPTQSLYEVTPDTR